MPHDEPHYEQAVRPGVHFTDDEGILWEVENLMDGGRKAYCHRVHMSDISDTRTFLTSQVFAWL